MRQRTVAVIEDDPSNASMDNPYGTPLEFPLIFLIPSWVSLCQAMTVSLLLLNSGKKSLSVNLVYVNSKKEWFQLVDCLKSFARYTTRCGDFMCMY